ncbi:folate-binding protein [Paucibacter sp. APW11]|uniref:Folate-binding protein n=1 Tax=Roseateles aquae TaxID=3077235 RepID=A0ABU3P535_9BURK|nr:folate-binding protein [Paucibacter sp. APW11]MDT8997689.1 folate-binding protein [Paucibacter sp. APW11]
MTTNTDSLPSGGAVRLAHWGIARAQGEDAAKFLHSQLTQDFALLKPDQARLAGYCSAKGRLLATLIGWQRSGPDDILLALPAALLAPTVKRLSMFVLRAKCKLSDASSEIALWGLAGTAAQAWLGEAAPASVYGLARLGDAQVIRLHDGADGLPRYLLAQAADAAAPALPALPLDDWQWLEQSAGLAFVDSATVEQFVPQMINLELLGGVNFQKGCYPGQEVVARSQYRGTVKRRTFLFEVEGQALPGQELFHSSDAEQPAGLVASSAQRGGKSLLLAEVKLAALEAGSLHLGAASGPQLHQQPLPYAVAEPQ